MPARADYTLAQAVAMVNLIADQWHIHFCFEDCNQCVTAHMHRDFGMDGPEPQYCPRGKQLQDTRAKWRRRCRYAARRAGVRMTI